MPPNSQYGQPGQPGYDPSYQQQSGGAMPGGYPQPYQAYPTFQNGQPGPYAAAPYGPPAATSEPYYAQPPQYGYSSFAGGQPQQNQAFQPQPQPQQATMTTVFQPHDPYAWQRAVTATPVANFPQPAIPYQQPGAQHAYGGGAGFDRSKLYAGLAVVVVMLTIGGIIAAVGLTANNDTSSSSAVVTDGGGNKISPEQLFQSALESSLRTNTYTQKIASDNRQIERRVDVSKPTMPRVSGSATIIDRNTVIDGYAGLNDTYIKLIKSPLLNTKPTAQGSWLHVRKAGTVLDASGNGGTVLDGLFTPTSALYGSFIIGNYDEKSRQALLAIINDQLVYRFDPTTVTQTKLDGQAASQYQVTVSASGQQALASEAARLAGVDKQRISEASTLAQLAGNANSKLVVTIANDSKRIVQVEDVSADDPRTVTYSAYNATKVTAAPQPTATWNSVFPQ